MKLGIIARGEDRGLGNQTYEACRHLQPERVLFIDPGPDRRFVQRRERFDEFDTTDARWLPGFYLDEQLVRDWLSGLDVVYTAETPYDDRLPRWAADAGCRVVIHGNAEQLNPNRLPQLVDAAWWVATPWRIETFPEGTRVVPMPVAQPAATRSASDGRMRFLHVAGWPTIGDRNGTKVVADCVKYLRSDCDVIVRGQHKQIRRLGSVRGPARLTLEVGSVANYWNLYTGADVLVLPRRFGGLSLVAQEGMSSGLGLVMTDCPPNDVWPSARVHARTRSQIRTPAGVIPMFDVDPEHLAEVLDDLVEHPEMVGKLKQEANEWARANSWEALADLWLEELERASESKS